MSSDPQRPAVDVVVPFAGTQSALAQTIARLGRMRIEPGDTVTIVDNRPAGVPEADSSGAVTVLRAHERQSSYFARNRGARGGSNPWLVFIDADVDPPADLLARYFGVGPGERAAVLSGAVVDEPPAAVEPQPLAVRYAALKATMSQANTLADGRWAYAQTANCAVRRDAFESVGGFRDDVRSGGDADLCFRLREHGWEIEARDAATVVHRSRRSVRALLRQQARHGSGAAWLAREHAGSFPRRRWLGLAKWSAGRLAGAAVAAARRRSDEAVVAAIEPLVVWAFEIGRLFPNEVAV